MVSQMVLGKPYVDLVMRLSRISDDWEGAEINTPSWPLRGH